MGFLHYLYFYFGLLLVGGFGAAGDVWLYHWGRYRDWVSLFIGLGLWLGSLLTFGMLVRYGERSLSATFILGAVLHIGAVANVMRLLPIDRLVYSLREQIVQPFIVKRLFRQ